MDMLLQAQSLGAFAPLARGLLAPKTGNDAGCAQNKKGQETLGFLAFSAL
jgi:hypothetical protein